MDSIAYRVRYIALGDGGYVVARPGKQAAGTRGTKSTLGDSNSTNQLSWFCVVFIMSPTNF